MMIPPWYGGAEIGKTPMALAVSTSCYLIKLNSLYLGTVLTLRRGRIVANSMSLTSLTLGDGVTRCNVELINYQYQ
jgi:hypothetical protein